MTPLNLDCKLHVSLDWLVHNFCLPPEHDKPFVVLMTANSDAVRLPWIDMTGVPSVVMVHCTHQP